MGILRVISAIVLFLFVAEVTDASSSFVRSNLKIKKSDSIGLKVKSESKKQSNDAQSDKNSDDDSDYVVHSGIVPEPFDPALSYLSAPFISLSDLFSIQTECDPPQRPPSEI